MLFLCFINKNFFEDESDDDENVEDIAEEIIENDAELDDLNYNKEINDNTCKSCSFLARNKTGLKIHMKSEHTVPCKQCEYMTTTRALLNKHKKASHK